MATSIWALGFRGLELPKPKTLKETWPFEKLPCTKVPWLLPCSFVPPMELVVLDS